MRTFLKKTWQFTGLKILVLKTSFLLSRYMSKLLLVSKISVATSVIMTQSQGEAGGILIANDSCS